MVIQTTQPPIVYVDLRPDRKRAGHVVRRLPAGAHRTPAKEGASYMEEVVWWVQLTPIGKVASAPGIGIC